MTTRRVLGLAVTTGALVLAGCAPTKTPSPPYQYTPVPLETVGAQPFTVPAGITQIVVDAYGAQGGAVSGGGPAGGLGGRAAATIPVTPGEVLEVRVGGAGTNGTAGSTSAGGFNGGGIGNFCGSSGSPMGAGGGGGGASGVRRAGSDVVVAGGGGGAGAQSNGGAGGAGGGLTGGRVDVESFTGGGGGTQTGGGASGWGDPAGDGTAGQGGPGIGCELVGGGGGGGGGYFGGGGGAGDLAASPCTGGGGGSGFGPSGATFFENGVRAGNGRVVIYY